MEEYPPDRALELSPETGISTAAGDLSIIFLAPLTDTAAESRDAAGRWGDGSVCGRASCHGKDIGQRGGRGAASKGVDVDHCDCREWLLARQ